MVKMMVVVVVVYRVRRSRHMVVQIMISQRWLWRDVCMCVCKFGKENGEGGAVLCCCCCCRFVAVAVVIDRPGRRSSQGNGEP